MNLYVSTTELKSYLGISASTHDALLVMFNKNATAKINSILSVSDLALHKVSAERSNAEGQRVRLRDLHAVRIGTIYDQVDTTPIEYTQTASYDIVGDIGSVLRLTNYLYGGARQLTVDYAAGWNNSGTATITVTDYANIPVTATITLGAISSDGFTITRGTDWTAKTSNDTEAAAIAAAIDAKAGVRAFAIKNVVHVVEDTNVQVATRTLVTSDSTRLTTSAGTLGSVDFPEDIRLAVMMIVSSLFSQRKNQGVKSYTIGSKSVTFATKDEFETFRSLLAPYMRVSIAAV